MAENNVPGGGVRAAEGEGYRQELNRALGFRHLLAYGMVFMVPIAPMGIYGYVVGPGQGMVPFIYIVVFCMLCIYFFPGLVTWLPDQLYGYTPPEGGAPPTQLDAPPAGGFQEDEAVRLPSMN